jgi:hypothetical protein
LPQEDRIEGLVARILNDRELVINRGSSHGVEVGMRFAVLAEEGLAITDPETGDLLDDVERPKTLVKVTQVRPKLAVAATYRTKTVGESFINVPSLLFRSPETTTERLAVDSNSYRPLTDEESIVKVRDKAVQVVGDEFSGWAW